jgi:UDP-N-acetylmuramate--alanine ligase
MHYHIVGIGGAGMSAVAHLLLDQGHTVSGSDLLWNAQTAALATRGAHIDRGHRPEQVAGADAVISTAAVNGEHPELRAAVEAGIPCLSRTDLWREWSTQRRVLAVAGTHGKTTTTAMIALILEQAGFAPGFMIGAEIPDLAVAARWGAPEAPLVIEADEYARAFLALRPQIAVITNIEWDHPDVYADMASYNAAFAAFAANAGEVMLSEEAAAVLAPATTTCTYGFGDAADYRLRPAAASWQAWRGTTRLADLQLALPGRHNLSNALAALAAVDRLGIGGEPAAATLAQFQGAARRFEFKGEVSGVIVIDDYAHHPTEVRATLAAARERYEHRRLLVYMQPHTYSRMQALRDAWGTAFGVADQVFIGDVFAAREQGDPAASARELVERIAAQHPAVRYVGSITSAADHLAQLLQPGDILLTLGAGDSYLVGETVLHRLQAFYSRSYGSADFSS